MEGFHLPQRQSSLREGRTFSLKSTSCNKYSFVFSLKSWGEVCTLAFNKTVKCSTSGMYFPYDLPQVLLLKFYFQKSKSVGHHSWLTAKN